MAPKNRDHNPSGLGRAIINKKIKDAQQMQESGLFSAEPESSKHLASVTQEKDLDAFLYTAQLAGTDFTAEKRKVKVLPQTTTAFQNPYLLSEVEEKKVVLKQLANKLRLRVPRRPAWTKSISPAELDRKEKASFLEWRRGLADLQDRDKFLLTPFERNLEVWRQLWRVLERSHLVVQIVDARNPLRFRCEDLETYVAEIELDIAGKANGKKRNMLLINKADLLTVTQRIQWADYFDAQEIHYVFYSAANAAAIQDVRRITEESSRNGNDHTYAGGEQVVDAQSIPRHGGNHLAQSDAGDDESSNEYHSVNEAGKNAQDPRAIILSAAELELMFVKCAPDLSEFLDPSGNPPSKVVVGLVGYPNVGKSSTINSLLGEKKVSVSSTPGKTKHFQTINLSDSIILCDCPGLVFPQFASTKADLVCDGVLPIDQLREYTGPISLITKRLPKEILEKTYGLTIRTISNEEGDDIVTAESLLVAYAIARGFMRSGQGNPDEARAARYVLKDYVDGKLLYSHPPPGVSETEYNRPTHENAVLRWIGKKHAPVTRVGKDSDTFVSISNISPVGTDLKATRSDTIDDAFFDSDSASQLSRPMVQQSRKDLSRRMLFPYQNTVAADGTSIDPHQARLLSLLKNIDKNKKHKKMKRVKQRSGKGYEGCDNTPQLPVL